MRHPDNYREMAASERAGSHRFLNTAIAGAPVRLLYAMGGDGAHVAGGGPAGRVQRGGPPPSRVGACVRLLSARIAAAAAPAERLQSACRVAATWRGRAAWLSLPSGWGGRRLSARVAGRPKPWRAAAAAGCWLHTLLCVVHAGTTNTSSLWTGSGGTMRRSHSCQTLWGMSTTGCL